MGEADADVVPRLAGRVLVVDGDGRVLLLHGFDPARPGEPYWFTIGGGAKAGESLADAAARELREESGICASATELGDPVWHEITTFSFDGRRYQQEQDFFVLRVGAPEISTDGLDDEEAAVVDGHRWWAVAELEATAETFYPRELPRLLLDLSGAGSGTPTSQADAGPGSGSDSIRPSSGSSADRRSALGSPPG